MQFPQNPSGAHFAMVEEQDLRQWTSVNPHHFFSMRVEISCKQLCAASGDQSTSINFTAQVPQPIAISVHFFPCATQTPAISALPCIDFEPEVASALVVLGISSDMMSLANLTLEHIIGVQYSANTSSNNDNISGDAGGSSSIADESNVGISSSFDSPLPAAPSRSRVEFTSHHCTQLQHAHSSGPSSVPRPRP